MTGMATPVMTEPETDTAFVEFVSAVPGFPDARTWGMEVWGDDPSSPFSVMRNVETEGLEFVVVSPFVFFPDYEPELDDATVGSLDLTAAEDAVVLVVLTIGESIEETTANLLGPIVINTRDNRAVQAILHQPGLSTKTPLIGS